MKARSNLLSEMPTPADTRCREREPSAALGVGPQRKKKKSGPASNQ